QVRSTEGLIVSIPNRKVTEATIQNLTRANGTYDSLDVAVTTPREVDKVLAVIKRALENGEQPVARYGISLREFNQKGETKTIKYRFSWFLTDYETRNQTRDQMVARIHASLAHEDLAGTEISVA